MSLLTAVGLHVQVGHQVLFRDLGCTIEPGQRIGLVGRNGTGKTTFLKVISGGREPDSGKVERASARVDSFVKVLNSSLATRCARRRPERSDH